MNPGSGDVDLWPITEQSKLFDLIGDVQRDVGVTLTESCLMVPTKSLSGLFFPSDVKFINCQRCTRSNCPGRKADYIG